MIYYAHKIKNRKIKLNHSFQEHLDTVITGAWAFSYSVDILKYDFKCVFFLIIAC